MIWMVRRSSFFDQIRRCFDQVLAMERYDNNDTISGSWVVLDSDFGLDDHWVGCPMVCGNPKDVG